ncbi:protein sym-1-like [Actinidia eriantha]|uniref:protein sym-1-like n=1 Tax=Actinidia eriantha TaxID=165200 RepID=UPI002582DD2F|nr:protein sym-1-like [Actinidia eriantha]
MMLKLWKWYQNCLAVHPVKTQIISSGLIWGFGDIAAQSVTHFTAKNRHQVSQMHHVVVYPTLTILNAWKYLCQKLGAWIRMWVYFRYEGLDRFMKNRLQLQPKSLRFVASKVALDGIIFGPLDLLVFFSYMGFSTGKSAAQVKEDVKRDFVPAFILEGGIWPILQVANFRYVPVRYQLLYVNFFCLLDSCFLSWVEQQQDAAWKQWFKTFISIKEQEGQGGYSLSPLFLLYFVKSQLETICQGKPRNVMKDSGKCQFFGHLFLTSDSKEAGIRCTEFVLQ